MNSRSLYSPPDPQQTRYDTPPKHGRSQDFFRGGGTLFPKNFQKICKNIQKLFKKLCTNFLTIFKKLPKNLLRKLLKMYFSYFSKNVTKTAFNFNAFGRKTLFAGNI